MKTENLIKAAQTASLLASDLRGAYSDAVSANDQFAAIVLFELLQTAVALETKIDQAKVAAT